MRTKFKPLSLWEQHQIDQFVNAVLEKMDLSQTEIRENLGTRMKPGVPAQGANQFTTHLPLLQRQDGP